MTNYAVGLSPRTPYQFRSGAALALGRAIDHVPIIEIFLRQDYGDPPANGVIVDVGANIGAYTVYAMSKSNARIFAFEPHPDYFELLERNVSANERPSRVRCFNAAVSGRSGRARLYVEGEGLFFPTLIEGGRDGLQAREVEATTLTDILDREQLTSVDLLKMDCEGAEYEILYNTPDSYFPRLKEIRVEHHRLDDGNRNAEALASFLRSRGYDIIRVKMDTSDNGVLWARRHD